LKKLPLVLALACALALPATAAANDPAPDESGLDQCLIATILHELEPADPLLDAITLDEVVDICGFDPFIRSIPTTPSPTVLALCLRDPATCLTAIGHPVPKPPSNDREDRLERKRYWSAALCYRVERRWRTTRERRYLRLYRSRCI
jgi:hypothetical protein